MSASLDRFRFGMADGSESVVDLDEDIVPTVNEMYTSRRRLTCNEIRPTLYCMGSTLTLGIRTSKVDQGLYVVMNSDSECKVLGLELSYRTRQGVCVPWGVFVYSGWSEQFNKDVKCMVMELNDNFKEYALTRENVLHRRAVYMNVCYNGRYKNINKLLALKLNEEGRWRTKARMC